MTSIDSINGMTHTEATKLRRARVRTTVTFLQIASTRSGRALLTKETGITSPKLLHWAKRAELMKIKNLGRDYADLLEVSGVESIAELKRRNPESLHETMELINRYLSRFICMLFSTYTWAIKMTRKPKNGIYLKELNLNVCHMIISKYFLALVKEYVILDVQLIPLDGLQCFQIY